VIERCRDNINDGIRPVLVTGQRGLTVAEGLADNAGLGDRIDIFEIEQFIALNLYELGKFAADGRRVAVSGSLKRDRADILHLQSLSNPEPNLACSTRTPFLGEAIESHPNRLDVEIALKIGSGVVSDRSGLRTFRTRLFQAFEHNVAKGALWRGPALRPFVEPGHEIMQQDQVVIAPIKARLG
jgi:Domain of unknown function (DUF4928)